MHFITHPRPVASFEALQPPTTPTFYPDVFSPLWQLIHAHTHTSVSIFLYAPTRLINTPSYGTSFPEARFTPPHEQKIIKYLHPIFKFTGARVCVILVLI